MTDRDVRVWTVSITALALTTVLLGVPSLIRVPLVLLFSMLAPGLAVTRYLPLLAGVDRLALSAATSLAVLIVTSLSLVAAGRWNGTAVLLVVALITLVLTVIPTQAPWTRRKAQQARTRNERIRDRRRAQEHAYSMMQSADPAQRGRGLMALSWLLEDDNRGAEAARLRALSRLDVPPHLPLAEVKSPSDHELRETHKRARSQDPEMRRRGLFEIAELLDGADRESEAATLRDLVTNDDLD